MRTTPLQSTSLAGCLALAFLVGGAWLGSAATNDPVGLNWPEGVPGWRTPQTVTPCLGYNPSKSPQQRESLRWPGETIALHPGLKGEYAVARWTCPATAEYAISAWFQGLDKRSTVEVWVLGGESVLYQSKLNLEGQGNEASYSAVTGFAVGQAVDFVVGNGRDAISTDTTALYAVLKASGDHPSYVQNAFSTNQNPHLDWTFGWLAASTNPSPASFKAFTQRLTVEGPKPSPKPPAQAPAKDRGNF